MQTDLFLKSSAEFSQDDGQKYRYELRRIWDESRPLVNWIMLNPSTADAFQDDPTVAKTQKFSKMWGYGGVIVTNIFAFRATDPAVMKAQEDPVGPLNDGAILKAAREAGLIVCAWGNHGSYRERASEVIGLLLNDPILGYPWLFCLGTNKTDAPKHPLYVSFKTKPSGYYGYGDEPNYLYEKAKDKNPL